MEPSMSDHGSGAVTTAHSHVGRYVLVWATLMGLTALTWGLSTVHIPGLAGVAVALAIASVKGALVALFFMHLWDQPGPNRLVLVTSLIFVALLISLPLLDNATRFPLANPPDAETAPQRIRDAILNEGPPAPAHAAPAHPQ
jgi:cytochrome c oxidase subunit 4